MNQKVQPSMLINSSTWDMKFKSFKMIPLVKDCPYIDVFYDPQAKVLVVHSEKTKDNYTLLPKLTMFGETQRKDNRALIERHRVEAYKEYYITEPEEIIGFVNMMAFNADTFNFHQYLGKLVEAAPIPEQDSTVALT